MKQLTTSKRTNNVITSPIRKFYPLVQAAEKKGITVLKLNVGDPDLPIPSTILQAIKNYRGKNLGYAPSAGLPEHVQAWSRYYTQFGVKLRPENIIPTMGAAEGILLVLMALTDSQDEVLVFEPLYTNYKGFATICEVKLIPVTLKIENRFALPKAEEIVKKVSPKTKAIIIINPNNPTGKVWTERELETIIKIAHQFGLFIICDETYREIVFKGQPSCLLSYRGSRELVIIIDSLSKRFSVPGLRIGALVSYHQELMEAVLKLAMMRLSAPTLGQVSTISLLQNSLNYTKKITREYQRRREVVSKALQQIPHVYTSPPQGAFYQVVQLPVRDTEKFITFLLTKFHSHKKTVLVAPMADFYVTPHLGQNEIRLAYVQKTPLLQEALTLLKLGLAAFLKAYPQERLNS